MESFKLYIPQKLPKLDIAKLNLKFGIGNRAK